jgi:hypothetical protein
MGVGAGGGVARGSSGVGVLRRCGSPAVGALRRRGSTGAVRRRAREAVWSRTAVGGRSSAAAARWR